MEHQLLQEEQAQDIVDGARPSLLLWTLWVRIDTDSDWNFPENLFHARNRKLAPGNMGPSIISLLNLT